MTRSKLVPISRCRAAVSLCTNTPPHAERVVRCLLALAPNTTPRGEGGEASTCSPSAGQQPGGSPEAPTGAAHAASRSRSSPSSRDSFPGSRGEGEETGSGSLLPSPLMRPGDGSGGMFQPGWPCLLSLFLNRNWSKLDITAGTAQWCALYARLRTRRTSAFGGPCFRLTVEYVPRWFESHHSAVPSLFLLFVLAGRRWRQRQRQLAMRGETPPRPASAAAVRRGRRGGATSAPPW